MTSTSRENNAAANQRFERALRAAIEARRPVASLEIEPETLSPRDRRHWRQQAHLDDAIHAWKQSRGPATKQGKDRLLASRTLLVSAALGLALLGLPAHIGSLMAPSRTSREIPSVAEHSDGQGISSPALISMAGEPTIARNSAAEYPRIDSDIAARRARLGRRASRLVYALDPVKQRVTTVMEQLIDAVPGGDLLAAWSQDT